MPWLADEACVSREHIYIYTLCVDNKVFFPLVDKTTSVWNQTIQACSQCANFTGTQKVHICMGHTHGTHTQNCATLSPIWIIVFHCTLYIFTNFAVAGQDKVNDAYKMPRPTETPRPELIGCPLSNSTFICGRHCCCPALKYSPR